MTIKARVGVIGGGIVGCSILYHLAKQGWTDVVLIEKNELTAGATWHAAGNTPTSSGNINMSRMQAYSIQLYAELERETGQSTGLHRPGSLSLACSKGRVNEYQLQVTKGRYVGLQYEIISASEAKKLFPLMNTDGVLAAIFDPLHGHVDPSSATNALAKGARDKGAKIHRHSKVTSLTRKPGGPWLIKAASDDFEVDIVVNAAGMWATEICAMVGQTIPMIPMLHQYIVTDAIPELSNLAAELPVLRDRDKSFYLRQERNALLFGIYEGAPQPWSVNGISPEFGQELLEPDLDRLEEGIMSVADRVPVVANAGLKRIIHGPIPFTPDERPIMGPLPGVPNFFIATGFATGIVQAGGAGRFVADWIVNGEPEFDPMPFHAGRFGDYATKSYTVARAIEAYSDHHQVNYPYRELPAGRPARMGALYDVEKNAGAVFGTVNGWERPLWFAPKGVDAVDQPSFERANWFATVGDECRAARENVSLFDMSTFGKYELIGPKAESFLNHIFTKRMPKEIGKYTVTFMTNTRGGILGDFTVARFDEDRFYIVGSGVGERYHLDWMRTQLPSEGVDLNLVSEQYGVLHIAGPKSKELLSRITDEDVSTKNFSFLSAKEMDLGFCRAKVLRVSFTGDLGYEIHVPVPYQRSLYERLWNAGADLSLRWAGSRALHALRLEKGYLLWGSDLTVEVTPYEANLGFMVSLGKNQDFIGRAALEAEKHRGPRNKVALLHVEVNGADAVGGESVYVDGQIVGTVTSGAFGHSVGKSLAVGYLRSEWAKGGQNLEVDILGERRTATILERPPFDPDDHRLRA